MDFDEIIRILKSHGHYHLLKIIMNQIPLKDTETWLQTDKLLILTMSKTIISNTIGPFRPNYQNIE